jgi:hypothetical protein
MGWKRTLVLAAIGFLLFAYLFFIIVATENHKTDAKIACEQTGRPYYFFYKHDICCKEKTNLGIGTDCVAIGVPSSLP